MRLEEWQRFIESQFLDDEPDDKAADAPPSKAAPSADTVPTVEADTPLFSLPDPDLDAPLESRVTSVTPSLAVQNCIRERGLFPSLPADEPEIPSFDQYLPASRRPLSQEIEPPASLPPPASEVDAPVVEPIPEQRAPENEIQTASEPAELPSASSQRAPSERRTLVSRAKHARNVSPESVPTGIASAELWAKVPRHMQTLLALERMDAEEVAQNSYKRPFAEKRIELIGRLLDPILTLEETARLLNVCPTTIRRYTNKGILTYYRKDIEKADTDAAGAERETRQRRFRLSDILTFLETQQAAMEESQQKPSRRGRVSVSTQDTDTLDTYQQIEKEGAG